MDPACSLLCRGCRELNNVKLGSGLIDHREVETAGASRQWYLGQSLEGVREQKDTCGLCGMVWRLLNRTDRTEVDLQRRVGLRLVSKWGLPSDCTSSWQTKDLTKRVFSTDDADFNKNAGVAGLAIELEAHAGSGLFPEIAREGLRICRENAPDIIDVSNVHSSSGRTATRLICPRNAIPPMICEDTFTLMRKWITDCIRDHEPATGEFDQKIRCNITVSGTQIDDETEPAALPTRVIAVNPADGPRVLETKGQTGRYVALSYRWGAVRNDTWMLRRSNIAQALRKLPLQDLPLTIQHAIKFTARLNFDYVWVDSCCIVQDDVDGADWKREAARMKSVYENATLCIAVLGDRNSHSGLLGRDSGGPTVSLPWVDEDQQTGDQLTVTESLPYTNTANRGECSTGLDQEIQRAEWSTRGWTYQEQFLSRRILYIGQHQVYFECQYPRGKRSEDGFDRMIANPSQRQSFVLGLNSTLGGVQGTLSRDPLWPSRLGAHWVDLLRKVNLKYLRIGIAQADVNVDELIWNYTSRSLTCPSDRLLAFEGLGKAIAARTMQDFVAGLWTNGVAKSLFWWLQKAPSQKDDDALDAPSWSWLSWNQRICGYDTELRSHRRMIVDRKHVDRGGGNGALRAAELVTGNVLLGERDTILRYSLKVSAACFSGLQVEPAIQCAKVWQQLRQDVQLWSTGNAGWSQDSSYLLFCAPTPSNKHTTLAQRQGKEIPRFARCPSCGQQLAATDELRTILHVEQCNGGARVPTDAAERTDRRLLLGAANFDIYNAQAGIESMKLVLLWHATAFNTSYTPHLVSSTAIHMAPDDEVETRGSGTHIFPSTTKALGFDSRKRDPSWTRGLAFVRKLRLYFHLVVAPTHLPGVYKRAGVAITYWLPGPDCFGGAPLHRVTKLGSFQFEDLTLV